MGKQFSIDQLKRGENTRSGTRRLNVKSSPLDNLPNWRLEDDIDNKNLGIFENFAYLDQFQSFCINFGKWKVSLMFTKLDSFKQTLIISGL